MVTWHIELKKVKDLKPHPRNPRRISKKDAEQLSKSIDRFGLPEKPIINLDNTIIGGHQRINILKTKKIKEIECWVPDKPLTDEEVDELCIRLNKNNGEFDFDILANEWDTESLLDYGFSLEEFGISEVEEIESNESENEEDKPTKYCPHCNGVI